MTVLFLYTEKMIDGYFAYGLIWAIVFIGVSLVQHFKTDYDDEESEKENKPVMWFFIAILPTGIIFLISLFS